MEKATTQERFEIIAYQHVRNKHCIYRKIENGTFNWDKFTVTEAHIAEEMALNSKFNVYEIKDNQFGLIFKVVDARKEEKS